MRSEDFHVDGLDQILLKMQLLDVQVGAKVLRDAGKDSMKPVMVEMRRLAHVGDEESARIAGYQGGDLRDSVVMRTRIGSGRSKSRVATISVGPLKKKHRGRTLSNITQKALAQEYGNENFKMDSFIRRAMDAKKREVINSLRRNFAKRFDKVWSKKL